ncbi:hypothetical protein TASIC1_0006055500 [Trichoderma asperellum]|uniref:Uncharacterized protein n=1 Tax=Trichoderma asperellum TaxID=101201 RepID=A0A6V8QVU1_TRIAP|nr:hypothetical protein TASIC1_0006055500 [Trichoderma asperellum]
MGNASFPITQVSDFAQFPIYGQLGLSNDATALYPVHEAAADSFVTRSSSLSSDHAMARVLRPVIRACSTLFHRLLLRSSQKPVMRRFPANTATTLAWTLDLDPGGNPMKSEAQKWTEAGKQVLAKP